MIERFKSRYYGEMTSGEWVSYFLIFLLVIVTLLYMLFVSATYQCPECTFSAKLSLMYSQIENAFRTLFGLSP